MWVISQFNVEKRENKKSDQKQQGLSNCVGQRHCMYNEAHVKC